MTYDKFTVVLLSMLVTQERDSTNAQLARYLLAHATELQELSVKTLADRAHVGAGTVSRFARDVGFKDFAELREAFDEFARSFGTVPGTNATERTAHLAEGIGSAVSQVAESLDVQGLARLVDDLCIYQRVSTFGLLKGQAAALDLQVDLLMQGKWVDTCTSLSEQMDRIAAAGADELVILFSYTGAYFEYYDLSQAMRRLDRPKIWMVCGTRRQQPDYVSDLLVFDSDLSRLGHPYQLEIVAGAIAQEYAARRGNGA